jgi:D-alanyl-D-alanine carboxypeptidase (penicillin-binding protein 5/6)
MTMKKKWFLLLVFLTVWFLHIDPSLALETSAKQAILLDMATGTVLFSKNADELMTPSSMSKIMTVYMLFESLKERSLSLTDTFTVSEKAWRKRGSKMFVKVNSRVKIEDLIRGIIVQSGNDATIVVAEGMASSESVFAEKMNKKATELGMTKSHFVNASGWPEPGHETTARDLAKLAVATIKNFPEFYHYYNEKSFTYNGIKQPNRNPTIYRSIGADGLKTGHTEAGGFGLTASAIRNNRRLVLVVNGLATKKSRRIEPERIIDWGFREYKNYPLFMSGETVVNANVWLGSMAKVPLVIKKDLVLTLTRKDRRKMKVKVSMNSPVPAPIIKGTVLGTLRIKIPEQKTQEIPLIAAANVAKLGVLSRLGAAIEYLLWGEVK